MIKHRNADYRIGHTNGFASGFKFQISAFGFLCPSVVKTPLRSPRLCERNRFVCLVYFVVKNPCLPASIRG